MDFDGTLIIDILAKVLGKLIHINERDCKNSQVTTVPVKFTSSYPPEMSIGNYLERIKKYARCSESCFIVALIYIDRAIELKNLVLSNLNVHRILITSILIAVKFLDDNYMNNAYYAKLGGISTPEMNMLELEFLLFLGFSLQVSSDLYATYYSELKGYVYSNPCTTNQLRYYGNSANGQLQVNGNTFDRYSAKTVGDSQHYPHDKSQLYIDNVGNKSNDKVETHIVIPSVNSQKSSYHNVISNDKRTPPYVNISPSALANDVESPSCNQIQTRFTCDSVNSFPF